MKAIICQNALGYIGRDNRMLWHCKAELKHFAELTAGCMLLVGYNTYINLPALKNRVVRLDARDGLFEDAAMIDWCIGGAKTYEKYAHLFTELHISTIVDNFDRGDVSMPKLENLNKNCKIFNYEFKIHS